MTLDAQGSGSQVDPLSELQCVRVAQCILQPLGGGAGGGGAAAGTHPDEVATVQRRELDVGGSFEEGVGGWNFTEISGCKAELASASGCYAGCWDSC